jgi:hypothetical protein
MAKTEVRDHFALDGERLNATLAEAELDSDRAVREKSSLQFDV